MRRAKEWLDNALVILVIWSPYWMAAIYTWLSLGTWFAYIMVPIFAIFSLLLLLLLAMLLGFMIRWGLSASAPWEPEYERRYPGRSKQYAEAIAQFINERCE